MQKKHNARTEKWREMMHQGIYVDQDMLHSRLRKGVPESVRALVWPQLLNVRQFMQSSKHNYNKLANSASSTIRQISLDIPRTFPKEEDSRYLNKPLNDVLKALSIVHPRIGYCQGMNFVVFRILQILTDEDTFWLLCCLFHKDKILVKNFSEPKAIESEVYVFRHLMRQNIPQILATFEKQNIVLECFAIKWFLTLYSGVLPKQHFCRLFEVYLYEGWPIIYAVGLYLLKRYEKEIRHNCYEENLTLLNKKMALYEKEDPFMQGVYSIEISSQTVSKLRSQYQVQNKETQSVLDRKENELQKREQSALTPNIVLPQEETLSKLEVSFLEYSLDFSILKNLGGSYDLE